MKKLSILLCTAMAFVACENSQEELDLLEIPLTSSINQIEIVEGVGIGDIITLGMSRNEVSSVVENGNCDSGDQCTFRLTPETAMITVTFNANNVVSGIEINQSGVAADNQWQTAQGVSDGMAPEDVANLYSGAEISTQYPYTYVNVKNLGYTYIYSQTCTYAGCNTLVSHYIYNSDSTSQDNRVVVGEIVISNSSRKTVNYTAEIEINKPDGSVAGVNMSITIPGRSSITINPISVVDINGPLGTYNYKVDLLDKKGRIKDTQFGSFALQSQ
ncbi:hypothetical protein [Aestuariibaculum sediminum]|uniref:Uncharacterized protein n=1 Tax=Aestuariibaculum sediminum TaxID=2770637 RepID=A0A8J6PZV4_9FLAO|nr:hypothetical protein [Aestuariibaculum sediminum]MBD0831892.1 hypothetical protein [Aestuariibaculum sediminum]